eukprot:518195-Pleurochrysis_carterae.AAC.1
MAGIKQSSHRMRTDAEMYSSNTHVYRIQQYLLLNGSVQQYVLLVPAVLAIAPGVLPCRRLIAPRRL